MRIEILEYLFFALARAVYFVPLVFRHDVVHVAICCLYCVFIDWFVKFINFNFDFLGSLCTDATLSHINRSTIYTTERCVCVQAIFLAKLKRKCTRSDARSSQAILNMRGPAVSDI